MEINEITFYTDSRVVLGYIQTKSWRFYVYIANRVQTIWKISNPKQWKYIDTAENPADLSTRCLNVRSLMGSNWLTGPSFLRDPNRTPAAEDEDDKIPLNENDPEVRKETLSLKMQTIKHHGLGTNRFSRFSSLCSLQRAIANLIVVITEFKQRKNKNEKKILSKLPNSKNTQLTRQPTAKELQEAMAVIISAVQRESFSEELKSERIPRRNKPDTVKKSSKLYRLDPFVDDSGVRCIGGRLWHTALSPVLTSDASIRISIYACVECIFVSIPSCLNNHSKWRTKRIICCFLHLLLLYAGADGRKDVM